MFRAGQAFNAVANEVPFQKKRWVQGAPCTRERSCLTPEAPWTKLLLVQRQVVLYSWRNERLHNRVCCGRVPLVFANILLDQVSDSDRRTLCVCVGRSTFERAGVRPTNNVWLQLLRICCLRLYKPRKWHYFLFDL